MGAFTFLVKFNFIKRILKAVFSQVAESQVKVPLFVFMNEKDLTLSQIFCFIAIIQFVPVDQPSQQLYIFSLAVFYSV